MRHRSDDGEDCFGVDLWVLHDNDIHYTYVYVHAMNIPPPPPPPLVLVLYRRVSSHQPHMFYVVLGIVCTHKCTMCTCFEWPVYDA